MMGLTAIEVVFLLLYIVIVTILVLIIMFESPTYNEKDYERYYRRKMREKDTLYKLLLDSLDKAENILEKEGGYLCSNGSTDFSSALAAFIVGKRIKRSSWNVSMRILGAEKVSIMLYKDDGSIAKIIGLSDEPFHQEDVLAEDWEILD